MKKGFTLIELLAVIIILAIVALIAVPIIGNVIENSRIESEKQSVVAFSRGVKAAIDNYMITEGKEPVVNIEWAKENVTTSGNDVVCAGVFYDSEEGVTLHSCKVQDSEELYCVLNTDIVDCNTLSQPVDYTHNCDFQEFWESEPTAESEFDYELYNNDTEARLLAYLGSGTDIVIPCTLGGKPVTEIGYYFDEDWAPIVDEKDQPELYKFNQYIDSNERYAFITQSYDGLGITSVKLNNNIERIGYAALSDNNLTTVTIPGSVINIGGYAFGWTELSEVILENGIVSIGLGAFESNYISTLTIPKTVVDIKKWAFSDNSLTEVTIPGNVNSVGEGAFDYNRLTDIVIEEGVTSIGTYAFSSGNLTTVTIPESVTYLGDEVFANNDYSWPEIILDNRTQNPFTTIEGVVRCSGNANGICN